MTSLNRIKPGWCHHWADFVSIEPVLQQREADVIEPGSEYPTKLYPHKIVPFWKKPISRI